jgi:DNA-binding NtrC family response regulator
VNPLALNGALRHIGGVQDLQLASSDRETASHVAKCVLIVDDDEDLRETLGDVLASFDACSVKIGSLREIERRSDELANCSLALIDINLGPDQPSGLDVCAWLIAHDFGGHIVFMTGHAAGYPLVRDAHAMRGVAILQKPIDLRIIEGMIDRHAP